MTLPPPSQGALVLTMGDPAGIAPEITRNAWRALRQSGPVFAALGAPELYADADMPVAEIAAPQDAADVFANALPVIPMPLVKPAAPGAPDAANASAVLASIEHAVDHVRAGRARAVVTNPIAKSVLYEAGFDLPGHTELLARLTESDAEPEPRGPVMMLTGGGLRVALVTIHTPLAAVAKTLSIDAIMRTARVVHRALRRDFGLAAPRIALAGLNPHAGEDGAIGREEIEIINPAAERLRADGFDVRDAAAADALFSPHARDGYDAALAMYHDQGLIPVKTLDFDGGVNITLGLPIVRTSPDHGTAFAIAGTGQARADSLIAALRAADAMAARRAAFTP